MHQLSLTRSLLNLRAAQSSLPITAPNATSTRYRRHWKQWSIGKNHGVDGGNVPTCMCIVTELAERQSRVRTRYVQPMDEKLPQLVLHHRRLRPSSAVEVDSANKAKRVEVLNVKIDPNNVYKNCVERSFTTLVVPSACVENPLDWCNGDQRAVTRVVRYKALLDISGRLRFPSISAVCPRHLLQVSPSRSQGVL